MCDGRGSGVAGARTIGKKPIARTDKPCHAYTWAERFLVRSARKSPRTRIRVQMFRFDVFWSILGLLTVDFVHIRQKSLKKSTSSRKRAELSPGSHVTQRSVFSGRVRNPPRGRTEPHQGLFNGKLSGFATREATWRGRRAPPPVATKKAAATSASLTLRTRRCRSPGARPPAWPPRRHREAEPARTRDASPPRPSRARAPSALSACRSLARRPHLRGASSAAPARASPRDRRRRRPPPPRR